MLPDTLILRHNLSPIVPVVLPVLFRGETAVIKIVLTVLLLAGCAAAPTAEQLGRADAGVAPGAEFPDTIRDMVKVGLKDPDSLKDLKVGQPAKCWYRASPLDPLEYGYCTTISYNAKNSYGGYVGVTTYKIFYRDGIIMHSEALM